MHLLQIHTADERAYVRAHTYITCVCAYYDIKWMIGVCVENRMENISSRIFPDYPRHLINFICGHVDRQNRKTFGVYFLRRTSLSIEAVIFICRLNLCTSGGATPNSNRPDVTQSRTSRAAIIGFRLRNEWVPRAGGGGGRRRRQGWRWLLFARDEVANRYANLAGGSATLPWISNTSQNPGIPPSEDALPEDSSSTIAFPFRQFYFLWMCLRRGVSVIRISSFYSKVNMYGYNICMYSARASNV